MAIEYYKQMEFGFAKELDQKYFLNYIKKVLDNMKETDKLFINGPELIKIYQNVIKNQSIEINGSKWPLDTLIIATSNNDEFKKFKDL